MLTNKQKEVLELIGIYIKEQGYSPTVRELASLCGIKSTSTMHGYLERLEKQGYISKHETLPRTIKVLKRYS
jgi:SOS-response transcriptional repressor LexA